MNAQRIGLFMIFALFMSPAFVGMPLSALEKESPEAKAATVNGAVITVDDVDSKVNIYQQRLTSMGKSLTESQLQARKLEVLESLINRELLYQESKKSEIKVDEAAVNEQLDAFKNRFPNEDEYKNALKGMNFSEAYLKSEITRDLMISQFIDKQFAEKITVSDEEARSYYDNHLDAFKKPEQLKASHILVKPTPPVDESSKSAARKKIEGIQQRLKNGEDFAALAKEFSQCPSSAEGGDLGYFARGQMAKDFEDAAFKLEPGEVSGIVETKYGYHIIKSVDKKPMSLVTFEEVKERLKQYLKENKVQEQVFAYVEEIKKKAKVERFITANP